MFPIGVGFPAMIVTTVGAPSLLVLVRVCVTIEGVLVMIEPALFVVVTKTVDCNVVLCGFARELQRHVGLTIRYRTYVTASPAVRESGNVLVPS